MTLTIAARPAPPRIQDPLDAVMRSCLRDEGVWNEIISTHAGLNQAEHWLKTTTSNIDQQLSFRQAEAEILRFTPVENRDSLIEHLEWRKGALYLKSLCEKRLIDLKLLHAADQSRSDAMKALLVRLADGVLGHEGERIDDHELYDALDEITLPGKDGPTLREYLNLRGSAR
ncbi:hypothetical protein [Arthrobacter rhizosphaerae]|uniref:hypothetical protein n=1 Tax=Arthrobacter rhizosphaerae TaxID=2855490 RepID=UPI001FF54B6B|nr:hypothetical protein [Arthrobacter rhizosphaerae]